jgi:glycine amidinotransferase/scyllo-inosamine-4-phosphate amidinotransferase 1|tara:strand:- start:9758 stop:10759 length:1002 start_codon:yes stop_codon:yes gene_type:complete
MTNNTLHTNKSNYATNEWDTLKKVVVGTATGATVPPMDISLRTVNYADVDDENTITSGPYPEQVIQESNEDLETLSKFLQGEGVEVIRPEAVEQTQYYDYCPRDIGFVHGEIALATPNPIRPRASNWQNIEHAFNDDLIVLAADRGDYNYNLDCCGDPDTLALNELTPLFDAANTIRANDEILYLVSNSGNKQGANLLQSIMADNATVRTLEGVYSYMHIDSTVAFLREGLMLLNPSRIKDVNVLPEPFRSWDYIMCPEPVDIGYHSHYNNASVWINMNLLSVSPDLVVLEEHQTPLAKELEKHGIQSAMLPIRHQRTLGGGFHCVTLDLERG